MNVLIKNSDFSQVSIGSVGNLPIGHTFTKIYFYSDGTLKYTSSNLKQVSVDLSQVSGSKVKVTGVAGSQKVLCAFFSGNAPTQDYTFTSQTEVDIFAASLGTELSYSTTESSGEFTQTLSIPNGANTLIINLSNASSTYVALAIELI